MDLPKGPVRLGRLLVLGRPGNQSDERECELGDVQAARDLEQDALDRPRGTLGPDHPDTLGAYSSLCAYTGA